MAQARKKPEEATVSSDESLASLARQCLAESGGAMEPAVEKFSALVNADLQLKSSLLDPFFERACRQTIAFAIHAQRKQIISSIENPREDGARSIRLLAQSNVAGLLDFPIWGGKPLKEATRLEIEESARRYREQSADMSHKGEWLTSIANKLKGTQTAGERFSESDLAKLWRESAV